MLSSRIRTFDEEKLLIQFIALLSVAILFGGMTLYSFGFAPMLFNTLPAAEAGRLLRTAFPWYYAFVILCAGTGGAVLLHDDTRSSGLMFGIALAAVYARQVLMPHINRSRDAQLRGDAKASKRFARLHAMSVGLNSIQMGIAAYVLFRFLR